jgi:hypothetical protein
MKLKHILAIILVIVIIGSMLLWSLLGDPAPDIDEQTVPTEQTK